MENDFVFMARAYHKYCANENPMIFLIEKSFKRGLSKSSDTKMMGEGFNA